jgi:hypothetical protein
MDYEFRQLDLVPLIDLLAEETEKYTRAFISGKANDAAMHKAVIDALVEEIKRRKEGFSPPPVGSSIPQNDISESSQ